MKTVGITAEYNPFHNGHVYHIETARERSGADCIIAVMSGDFTQRGEPAVSDKWERARAAVSCQGVNGAGRADLVIELPFVFACSRAAVFAAGAVDMLVRMGVDCISFGCEAEEPDRLEVLAQILMKQSVYIDARKHHYMQSGASGAKAYEKAVRDTAGDELTELMLKPNNILAIEYIKRILLWRNRGRDVEILPVKRYGSGYKDSGDGRQNYAGAGALREMLKQGDDITRFVPETVEASDVNAVYSRYFDLIKGVMIRSTEEQLANTYGIAEGLQNRMVREIRTADSLAAFTDSLVSRRYTQATVMRALTHLLLQTTWENADTLTRAGSEYGRVLASGAAGRKFIRESEDNSFRIITNINKETGGMSPEGLQMLRMDEKASDLYNLLRGRELYAFSDRVTRPFIAQK